MADPVAVPCPANQWTIIAANVEIGIVDKKLKDPNIYLHTYRETGGAAPTDPEEGVPLFEFSSQEAISSSTPIDVYVYARNNAGEVRVSL